MTSQTRRQEYQEAEKDASYPLEKIGSGLEFDNSQEFSDNSITLKDEALNVLPFDNTIQPHISPEEDTRLVRKIDRHLMPIMFCIYFLQLVDKQTLSFSSVFGLSRDADLVGDDYSLLGSIVFIAQLVMQPVSAYFLVKFRLSIYVPVIVTCWGATLLCMSAARNFIGLLIARFFLGAFEASVQASFILVVQFWYRRQEQGFRLAVWYSNLGWVNIFGSLIMFGLGHIKSGVLFTYQIVFLLLGATTFIVGMISFFIFPDNPVRSSFLTTEEKVMAVERIRANQQGLETKDFKIKQALEMILDPKSWCWMLLMFVIVLPGSGVGTFGPLIIKGFGFSGYNVMLLMIPFGVLQVIFMFGGFWVNRRFSLKFPIILLGLLPPTVSAVILLRTGRSHQDQPLLLFAYYSLSAFSITSPTIVNWHSSNVAGHTKRTSSISFMVIGTFAGGIVGPLLFSSKDKPYYRKGIISMLVCYSVCFIIVIFTALYLRHLNGVNRMRRIRRGKVAEIVDYSMISAAEAERERQSQAGQNGDVLRTGAHAFDDLTDLENDEFIYVY